MNLEPLPDWVIPPYGGFTADSFLRMRGLPKRTELIDGGLVFRHPQAKWHSAVRRTLDSELDRQAPADFRAYQGMSIRIDEQQVPEPDVIVITAEADERSGPSTNFFWAKDVVLVVEAVAPDTLVRDRDTKPRKYAAAGIRHHWRVERDNGKTVVYVYELDPATGNYFATGIHSDRLVLPVPFPLDIDLTAIDDRR